MHSHAREIRGPRKIIRDFEVGLGLRPAKLNAKAAKPQHFTQLFYK